MTQASRFHSACNPSAPRMCCGGSNPYVQGCESPRKEGIPAAEPMACSPQTGGLHDYEGIALDWPSVESCADTWQCQGDDLRKPRFLVVLAQWASFCLMYRHERPAARANWRSCPAVHAPTRIAQLAEQYRSARYEMLTPQSPAIRIFTTLMERTVRPPTQILAKAGQQ